MLNGQKRKSKQNLSFWRLRIVDKNNSKQERAQGSGAKQTANKSEQNYEGFPLGSNFPHSQRIKQADRLANIGCTLQNGMMSINADTPIKATIP